MLTIMKRPGIVNQLYFSMAQKLLPAKPKAAPDHLFVLQVQYLGDGMVMLVVAMQFPAGISIDLLVWLSCRVSYINNNMISG